MVDMKNVQKLSYLANTVLLVCMFTGFISFRFYGVTYMAYHCIPTIVILIVFYYLIYREKLYFYVNLLYVLLAVYMVAATVCLGYSSGFHLYCMSLIPLTFYMEYMADKLRTKRMRAIPASFALVSTYLVCSGYVILKGPLYDVEAVVAFRFMVVNAVIVFCFVIGYANLMLKLVMSSENKLTEMAHRDFLTGLFNRHYMMRHLDALCQGVLPQQWIAMADIDDFKNVNDTYGHNCGDYVLVELAKIMQDVCQGCTISRWGGEEFLIICNAETAQPEILEELRQRVERSPLSYEGKDIVVTITVGVSYHQPGQSLNSWIQSVDAKLYKGKESSKNCVIY